MNTFITNVTQQVIERHLVAPLPDIILSPGVIAGMSDEEVKTVAAEARATTDRRNHLEQNKAMLEKGLDTFREAIGGVMH